jgi:hypothetical protein
MTTIKLLSAALIAAGMLATPAIARDSRVNSRHLAMDANASAAPGARSTDDRSCHRAPAVGAFASDPRVKPPCDPAHFY